MSCIIMSLNSLNEFMHTTFKQKFGPVRSRSYMNIHYVSKSSVRKKKLCLFIHLLKFRKVLNSFVNSTYNTPN